MEYCPVERSATWVFEAYGGRQLGISPMVQEEFDKVTLPGRDASAGKEKRGPAIEIECIHISSVVDQQRDSVEDDSFGSHRLFANPVQRHVTDLVLLVVPGAPGGCPCNPPAE